MLHVSANQFDLELISDVDSLLALRQQSINARLLHANKRSLWSDAGDYGIAVGGDRRKFAVRVRIGLACQHCFNQSLGHDVRKAAIGGGRVRVVLHRESEMSGYWIARPLQDIFSRPN